MILPNILLVVFISGLSNDTCCSNHCNEVATKLKAKGIPTAVYYPKSIHEQPVFAPYGYKAGQFPVSEKAANEVLSLPMHPFLTATEQDQIVSALDSIVNADERTLAEALTI